MSKSKASDQIDWDSFEQSQPPLNLEDLRRYSSADLDPFTVQLGQKLCERFTFSPEGHRNLSFALSDLSKEKYWRGTFEIGFGSQHAVITTLKSNSGFLLIAIVGTLAEYYHEDFVVQFFQLLTKNANVPQALVPIERQWRSMVNVLYGVLATSSFGVLLSSFEDICPAGLQDPSPETILDALIKMNNLARHTGKPLEISVGADAVWIASAARWLYDLKIILRSQAQNEISRSPGVQTLQDADLVLHLSGSSAQAAGDNRTGFDGLSLEPRTVNVSTGGRVAFNDVFRSCFRAAFSTLDGNLLAAYLSCAAHILHGTLADRGTDSRTLFLAQASDKPGQLQHGLIETLVAWFPELQRLTPRLRHYQRLSLEEARKLFDEKVHDLQTQCICPICRNDLSSSTETCKITLVEVIVSLGLIFARMSVTPKLYLKRKGVVAFYERQHAMRVSGSRETTLAPSDDFVKRFVGNLPLTAEILQIGFLLFANASVESDSTLMGLTHAGLSVFLNGRGEVHDSLGAKSMHFVGVVVVPGSLCLYGHEARREVWDQGFSGETIEQAWRTLRNEKTKVRQIMKWQGDVMLCSFVKDDINEQKRAKNAGWLLLE